MALPITDAFNQNTGSTQGIATYNANFTVLEGGMEVKSGNVGYFGGTTGTYNTTRNNSETFNADQYAQNKVTSVQISGAWYGGPAVRCQTGAVSGYHVETNGGAGGVYYLSKVLAGVQSTLSGPISMATAAGDILKITVEDNGGNADLKVWKALAASPTSFIQQGSTYTDSSSPITTAGYAGFFIYGSSSGDGPGEWTAGDINPASTAASRRKKRLIYPGNHPGPFGARLRTRRYNTAILETITGTLATTNADDTSAAAGSPIVNGSSATTNANDTSAAAGSPIVNGSSSTTNANDTSAASGTTTVTGTSSTTNADDTSAAAGTVTTPQGSRRLKTPVHPGAGPYSPLRFKRTARNSTVPSTDITGTSNTTNADDTSAASGTTTILGTSATTNANDTSAASGTTTVTGSSATTNADDTSAAAGTTTITGTSTTTNANDTSVASGFLPATGTVNVTNANDTVSAQGTAPSQGGGSVKVKTSKKKKKKATEEIKQVIEEIKEILDKPREITEEEAAGMAAMYGGMARLAPALDAVEEAIEEIAEVVEETEPIIPEEISQILFTADKPKPAEVLPEEIEEEDEIALILAIIEAIG